MNFEVTSERKVQPSMLARAEEIQSQIDQLSGRDLQLWSIGILLILVLTSGLLALVWPNLAWSPHLHIEHAYLPQLFFGLISLVLLGNVYLISQKRALNATRHALIRELVLNERLESLSLIDPLTQLLNRRAVNELIPRETSRCNRTGTVLVVIAMDIDRFHEINEKFGALEGDRLLVEFAGLLKKVFRGGDIIFRQGGDEFLALLPDTNEEQAIYPMQRLAKEVEQWNLNSRKEYELSFASAVAAYITGTDGEELLRTIDRKMYHKKHQLVPVF
jgi:diguanylate cyclase (GGDEF)-like protein